MKNLFIALMLFISTLTFSQTYYCVQVCSTENPHLLKPMMFSILYDTPMVEVAIVNGRKRYRILFVYETSEDQSIYHTSWLKQWHDALMVTRTKKQVEKLVPLFTTID
jgi:hypothetical protein